jgi:dolichyl-diphosphooligosaccharide--protein glycosyltransferase/undecaprenyl-diphosphooligosaccharide--protein glycosyltransferase
MDTLKYIQSFLNIKESKTPWKIVFLLIIVSYIFSLAIRMIWVVQVENQSTFYWNNEIMINTNDGYHFAQGAKDILDGKKLFVDSPINSMISKLTAFYADLLPYSFESLILYLPAFLGSLLVIPIILIARSLNIAYVGFSASLIASIAWSYYNRTMVGYYDTDMLNVVLPFMLVSLIILSIHEKKLWFLLFFPILMIFYSSWYNASFIYLPLLISTLFYILVFERKKLFNYQMLSIYMISMSTISLGMISVGIVSILVALFYLLENKLDQEKIKKIVYGIFTISLLLALSSGGFTIIYNQLEDYVFRKAIGDDLSLIFYNVVGTVREAGHIPFEMFANRISGGVSLLYISTIGLILLVIRYPIMLITIPLVGVGFVALSGGLRFTVYTVPLNALGMAFIIFLFATYIRKYLLSSININGQKIIYVSIIFILLSINLNTHIQHVKGYMVPTVFTKKEVGLLDTLSKRVKEKDYIVSWWDYGYPIRYYGQVQTLIDGGKHSGDVNFPVSFALSSPQISSANMLRLDVEIENKRIKRSFAGSNIENIMKEYGYKTPQSLLKAIGNKDFKIHSKTSDAYLYLPYKLLGIYPTVSLFSNLDLSTGRVYPRVLFFNSTVRSKLKDSLVLSQGVKVFIKNGQFDGRVEIGQKVYNARYFIKTAYKRGTRKLEKIGKEFDKSSNIYVVYMENYGRFLILDSQSFYSTFIQLFVLEDYDKSLYEPVALDPQVKIYKLKK